MGRDLTAWQRRRVEDLFSQLYSVAPGDLSALLDRECQDDLAVRGEVESLFRARVDSGTWGPDSHPEQLQKEMSRALEGAFTLPVGAAVDDFRIIRFIAEGGMGTVYEAEQQHPRRRVALKLMRAGLVTMGMTQRFKYETEVLARLEHPGIARIYHAGIEMTAPGPRPFFAMEFIDGRSLDEHARDKGLGVQQRLRLLIEICQAVHYAHSRGVIHRDLKPANILVTADGQPKVLDFGIARATDLDMHTTLHTQTGEMVGTLPFMAPEQAAGKLSDVDASSDVYALGVVAFQLLGGRMPYQLEGKPLYEVVRTICQQEPTRLSHLNKAFRGDVETIVGKALEKEKLRRYTTAEDLAADIRRYLDDEPIAARPPSTWYNLKKFTARNKVVVGAVAAIIAALTIGLIVANQQRRVAEQRAAEYQAVSTFLEKYHMGDRWRVNRNSFSAISVIEDTERALNDGALRDQPAVAANLRFMLGNALRQHSRLNDSARVLADSVALREATLGEGHVDLALSRLALGAVYCELGRYPDAEAMLRKSMPVLRTHPGADLADVLANLWFLGRAHANQNRFKEGEAFFKEAMQLSASRNPSDLEYIAYLWHELALLYLSADRLDDAEQATVSAYDLLSLPAVRDGEAVYGWEWIGLKICDVQWTQVEIYEKRQEWGRVKNRCYWALKRLESFHRDSGPRRMKMGDFASKLGDVHLRQGALAEGEEAYRKALAARRTTTGDRPDVLAMALRKLYGACAANGKLAEAEQLCREALGKERQAHGAAHLSTLEAMCNLVILLHAQGKQGEAEIVLNELRREPRGADLAAKWVTESGRASPTTRVSKPTTLPTLMLVPTEG